MDQTESELVDVVAVEIQTGKVSGVFSERVTPRNAEAIIEMAVMRRGVEDYFYTDIPTGKLKVGDKYP